MSRRVNLREVGTAHSDRKGKVRKDSLEFVGQVGVVGQL